MDDEVMAIEQLPVRRTTNPSSRHTSCVRTCLCDSREPRSHGPAGRRALLLALLDALLAGGRRRWCQPAKAPPLQRRALLAPAREPNLSPLALQGDVLARAFRRLPPADLACAELVCRRFRSEGEAQRGRPWSPGWLPAPWRGGRSAPWSGVGPLSGATSCHAPPSLLRSGQQRGLAGAGRAGAAAALAAGRPAGNGSSAGARLGWRAQRARLQCGRQGVRRVQEASPQRWA
jgi:hypothetical protein